jgi:hypothetical protein
MWLLRSIESFDRVHLIEEHGTFRLPRGTLKVRVAKVIRFSRS